MTIYDFRTNVSTVQLAVGDRMRVTVSNGNIVAPIYGKAAGQINYTTTGSYTLLNFVFLNGNMDYDIMFIDDDVTTIAGYKILPVIGQTLLWVPTKLLTNMYLNVDFKNNYSNRDVRVINTCFFNGSYKHLIHVQNEPLPIEC